MDCSIKPAHPTPHRENRAKDRRNMGGVPATVRCNPWGAGHQDAKLDYLGT